jgi:hypothetical protein
MTLTRRDDAYLPSSTRHTGRREDGTFLFDGIQPGDYYLLVTTSAHMEEAAGRGPMVLSAEVGGGALLSIQRRGEEIAGKTLEFAGTETLDDVVVELTTKVTQANVTLTSASARGDGAGKSGGRRSASLIALPTDHRQAVGPGSECKGFVMSGHCQRLARHLLPEKRRGQVDGVERPELGRHRLGRPVQHDGIDVDKFERGDQLQDRRSPPCNLGIGQLDAETKAIERSQTLRDDQGARDTTVDLRPLRQRIRLAEGDSEQDRRIHIRNHRSP